MSTAWIKDHASVTHEEVHNALVYKNISHFFILFTQPFRSGRIWHKVNF